MEAQIVRLDDTGRGICYIDGKITFVPKTVVGDTVLIDIVLEKKNYNVAKLVKVIEPSCLRIDVKCKYFNECGGCDLQNISYEESVNYKLNKVSNLFSKNNINVKPELILNEREYNYRNKITLKVVDGKIGYYESRSHSIIKIDECLIAKECINKTINNIKDINILNGEIVIRCNHSDEILIYIKSNEEIKIDVDELSKGIKLVGIVLNDETIYGENYLYMMVNNLVFKVSYDSFFQVNEYVASKLFNVVKDNVNEDDVVFELYSGVGTLSLSAAQKCKKVIGVEIVANAVLNAINNAKINKINNTEFVLNDASKAVDLINLDFNKLIVDPPRSGLTKEIIDRILTSKPESIIYVSCDVQTLIRDVNLLSDEYKVEKIYVLDMFSYTYHNETVCILKKQ